MRPLLVFDRDCSVCRKQVGNLRYFLGDRFDAESFRDAGFFEKHPEFAREACERALHFRSADGRVFQGAEAVARAAALRALFLPFSWLYYVPGLRQIWDSIYVWIARNRIRGTHV